MNRSESIGILRSGTLDVLVIGGGINGAGVLRDLALRNEQAQLGLRIGLLEKGQFGSGTSGRNSHLIHGGLRYLKRLDIQLVREALAEREMLLRNAPQFVESLAFLLPFETNLSRLVYGMGLLLYDGLAGANRIGRHRHLSRTALSEAESGLRSEQFTGAARYFDCRVESAPLVLATVRDAAQHGAAAANYVDVGKRLRGDDGTWTLEVEDLLTSERFQVKARRLVDASGAWMQSDSVRLVRGSHLIYPRLNQSTNAIAYFEPEGRIVFFIPWGTGRRFTLVGTTDVDHTEGADEVRISGEETEYLHSMVRKLFRNEAKPISSFSSLRPLVREEGHSATSTSREHRIWFDDEGVLRITGGKYTTYRLMSEQAVTLLLPAQAGLLPTRTNPIVGGGAETDRDPIAFAVTQDMAQRLTDVLYVSTTWGYERIWDLPWLLSLANQMGRHLGWDPARVDAEAEAAYRFASDSVPLAASYAAEISAT